MSKKRFNKSHGGLILPSAVSLILLCHVWLRRRDVCFKPLNLSQSTPFLSLDNSSGVGVTRKVSSFESCMPPTEVDSICQIWNRREASRYPMQMSVCVL